MAIVRPERECAREGCGNLFTPRNVKQKFCEPRCERLARDARRSQRKRDERVKLRESLSQALDDAHERDIHQDNARELKRILATESRMRRYTGVLERTVRSYEPTRLVAPAPSPDDPTHEWLLVLGDWHVGQQTRIEETGSMYEQDVSTTRQQVAKIWEAVDRLHAVDSAGRGIPKLHVLFIGDLVDGDDMRPSQHRRVEDVVTVQTVQAFDLLTWLLRQCLQIFPEVEVDMVGGNHDRTGRNRGDAGLGELDYIDTWAWLAGAFVERSFANEPRIRIRNWQSFYGFKEIAGKRVVFEHGSSFKWGGGYAGVPFYNIANLAPRYAAMLGEPDLVVIGHGHRPALIPHGRGWIVVNGALPATSTYQQSSFKTVLRPQQWLMSLHEDHGVTSFQPLYLDVPGQLKPGDLWDDVDRYAELATSTERRTG